MGVSLAAKHSKARLARYKIKWRHQERGDAATATGARLIARNPLATALLRLAVAWRISRLLFVLLTLLAPDRDKKVSKLSFFP